jgi:hypothetical protein
MRLYRGQSRRACPELVERGRLNLAQHAVLGIRLDEVFFLLLDLPALSLSAMRANSDPHLLAPATLHIPNPALSVPL